MQYTLENDLLTLSVDENGAEMVSLKRADGEEMIWSGDPAYWGRHAPVLFPQVGRHFKDRFRVNGKEYRSSQHGFARDMKFDLVSHEDDSLTFSLCSDSSTLQAYPFPFELLITYTLKDDSVFIDWEVRNTGEEEMYFGIGAHPAFLLPGGKEGYAIRLKQEPLSYKRLSNGCVLKESHPLALTKEGLLMLNDTLFENDALVFDGGQIEEAAVLDPEGKTRVLVKSEGFPYYGIWSVPGASFVCLEPWASRTDNVGFTGELKEKDSVITLKAGNSFNKQYQIQVPQD